MERDDNSQQQFEQDEQQQQEHMKAIASRIDQINAPRGPSVYRAIARVAAEMARTGVAKDRVNQGQRFNFRGIDDVMNALAPVLSDNALVILPRVMSREVVERKSNNGGALFNVTVMVEFDFVCATDGSRHTVCMAGEAMDSADKATNKAMSAAYKYACFQAFCIPTEGTPDADSDSHHVEQAAPPRPRSVEDAPAVTLSPEQIDNHCRAIAEATSEAALKASFEAAYRHANGANNLDALAVFTAAKNARKAALSIPQTLPQ